MGVQSFFLTESFEIELQFGGKYSPLPYPDNADFNQIIFYLQIRSNELEVEKTMLSHFVQSSFINKNFKGNELKVKIFDIKKRFLS